MNNEPSQMSAARNAISGILAGNLPSDTTSFGEWSPVIGELVSAHEKGGPNTAKKVFSSLCKANPTLYALMATGDNNQLIVERTFNGYTFTWSNGITIRVYNLRFSGDNFTSIVEVIGASGDVIEHSRLNMLSTSNKTMLIRNLKASNDKSSNLDWNKIITKVCHETINLHRKGEATVVLQDGPICKPMERMLIDPLIIRNQINIIFGDGGTGKSTFAVFLAGLLSSASLQGVELPYDYAGFKIFDNGSTLFLDWETDKDSIEQTMRKIFPDANIVYKKCTMPLSEMVENVRELIAKHEIRTVIIDSVGMAAGSDLNASEIAIRFSASCRQLETTVIAIAHNAKNQEGKKTIFGSVFFHNAARNVWEYTSSEDENASKRRITLYHRKSNITKIHSPISLAMNFSDDLIFIEQRAFVTVGEQICELLAKDPCTVKDLVRDIPSVKETVIKSCLTRLRNEGTIKNEKNVWLLV